MPFRLPHSALRVYYNFADPSFKQSAVYTVSKTWTNYWVSGYQNKNNNQQEIISEKEEEDNAEWLPWNLISSFIMLGKIASVKDGLLVHQHQHEEIKKEYESKTKRKLKMIAAITDMWEQGHVSVVSGQEWKELISDIIHFHIPMQDFTANVPNEIIAAAVLTMREVDEANEGVFVHCKAGRSRSAMLSLIYLYLFGDGVRFPPASGQNIHEDLVRIAGYINSRRGQVNLLHPSDLEKITKAEEVIRYMRSLSNDDLPRIGKGTFNYQNESSLAAALERILKSLELKNLIVHMWGFKNLLTYACRNQGRATYSAHTQLIRDFFMNIYDAQNVSWFIDLQKEKDKLTEMVETSNTYSHPYLPTWATNWATPKDTPELQTMRKELRNSFIEELENLLCEQLCCTKEQLQEATRELTADFSFTYGRAS